MGKKEDIELLQIQVGVLHARLDAMQINAEAKQEPTLEVPAWWDQRDDLSWDLSMLDAGRVRARGNLWINGNVAMFKLRGGPQWAFSNTTLEAARASVERRIRENDAREASAT